jgi:hypothetical protein
VNVPRSLHSERDLLPRRRPNDVVEHRIALSDFERQQLADAKMIALIGTSAVPLAGAAIGLGLAAAGYLAFNSIEDLSEFLGTRWESWFKADEEEKQAIQAAVTDEPASLVSDAYVPGTGIEGAPSLEGMSAAGMYDAIFDMKMAIVSYNYRLWLAANPSLDDKGSNWTYFVDSAAGIMTKTIRVATNPGNQDFSQFAYQMAIRETAARRLAGFAGSVGVGGALLSYGGVLLSTAVWGALNLVGDASGEWTSSDATEAPGYVQDALLDAAWSRCDFPGADAPQGHPYTVLNALAYEEDLIAEYVRIQGQGAGGQGPTDLSSDWPPAVNQ